MFVKYPARDRTQDCMARRQYQAIVHWFTEYTSMEQSPSWNADSRSDSEEIFRF